MYVTNADETYRLTHAQAERLVLCNLVKRCRGCSTDQRYVYHTNQFIRDDRTVIAMATGRLN